MDALQIQGVRAMLAAQTAVETRPPSLARKLKRLLAPKSSPSAYTPLSIPAKPTIADPACPLELDDHMPLILGGDVMLLAADPVPPQVLLGDLTPRRRAFGQRQEAVLELNDAAPAEPQRLTLIAADGAAVGEIILHAGDMEPANAFEVRSHCEPLHSEVPFFPGDLADEPRPRRAAGPKTSPLPASPPRELAATFLLATLAARLASEEALLRQRLSATRSLSLVA